MLIPKEIKGSSDSDFQPDHLQFMSKRDLRENTSSNEDNPFSGPKLHLFKKGQSRTKQRKIKTSQYNQRTHEMNSNYTLSNNI